MNRKDKMNLLLSKVPEAQKEAFVKELRETKNKEERGKLLKKYGVSFTEEEAAELKEHDNKISDEELDNAAGGCCTSCTYNPYGYCVCGV